MSIRYSVLTQELANIYPEWSRVRIDEQSLGQRTLNALVISLETIQKEFQRSQKNIYLTTANLDEIDWVYKVTLPSDFSFVENNADPIYTNYETPIVGGFLASGVLNSGIAVTLAENNDIETFWYKHRPDRVDAGEVTADDFLLLNDIVDNAPFSGILVPHIPGHLYIELTGGSQYINVNEDRTLDRGSIYLHGLTRKGTEEDEILIFPWDQKRRTIKEWQRIDSIECINIETGVQIKVYSADFANGPYLDFWNLAYSENRQKIDQFWDISNANSFGTLDLIQYTSDDIAMLLNGLWSFDTIRQFELLDTHSGVLTVVDMAIQPFTDYIWVATDDNRILCYDHYLTTCSPNKLVGKTDGAGILIEFSLDHIIRNQTIDVNFVCCHNILPITDYRTWVEYPDGTKKSIIGGTLTTYNTFWNPTIKFNKQVDIPLSFSSSQRGEHLFNFEVKLTNGTIQIDKRILNVDYKIALTELDISPICSGVLGIDFDSDQHMQLLTANGCQQINLHHDTMMVDFNNKVIYFREPYEEVYIWPN